MLKVRKLRWELGVGSWESVENGKKREKRERREESTLERRGVREERRECR